MKPRLVSSLLVATALVMSAACSRQAPEPAEAIAPAGEADAAPISQEDGSDAAVKARLDSKGTPYVVDEDGDFQITVRVDDDRTQLVWVRSSVEATDEYKVREIWSPGYRSPSGDFSAAIANDLLERSNLLKLGAWVKQDDVAMLVIKIPADAGADALDEAIDLAAASADAVERELLGSDEL